jgi:hypothetical protein
MQTGGLILRWLGWILTLGPLTIFVAMSAYVWFINPADQAGWGALLFVVMMLTAVSLPAGLLVLGLSLVLRRSRIESRATTRNP